jgi:hypothetical protein
LPVVSTFFLSSSFIFLQSDSGCSRRLSEFLWLAGWR